MAVAVTTDLVDRRAAWHTVARAGVALVAAMGVGRFAYTPILPIMHAQAGMSAQTGALVATGNYVGYFGGAVAAVLAPRIAVSRKAWRVALLALVLSMAAMPLSRNGIVWFALRLIAGATSALILVFALHAVAAVAGGRKVLAGWAFGGVGVGIALSGALVLALEHASWRATWSACAVLAAACALYAWPLVVAEPAAATSAPPQHDPAGRAPGFGALMASYTLEGVGYIIAGTFLVAAVQRTAPAEIGSAAWILVGLAAFPSTVLWTRLAHRFAERTLLVIALAAQSAGMALPALFGGMVAAMVSAVLFGATFMGIVALATGIGTHLRGPRAVALLTTGYAAGQVLGPLLAAPLLHSGYRQALLLGAGLVAASMVAALGIGNRR
ncbi:YbfB/YjiJ family MFS transporter [Nocardia arthritidis]|uniref:YbfB/YjiJ family MFS transporter n=1 Tax=Nocardia arthritidis TaxID=228602 RepID=A0A6G9YFH5_9NOCA|nr:YbfB/YjiJ family MFS transporter [Nocardia arthritidis]QIS11827.1 YbfB/YjiJ family MFS transporter [Nocardia arthritidis]